MVEGSEWSNSLVFIKTRLNRKRPHSRASGSVLRSVLWSVPSLYIHYVVVNFIKWMRIVILVVIIHDTVILVCTGVVVVAQDPTPVCLVGDST